MTFAVKLLFEKVFTRTCKVSLEPLPDKSSIKSPSLKPPSTKSVSPETICTVEDVKVRLAVNAVLNAVAEICKLMLDARASIVSEIAPTVSSLFAIYVCALFVLPNTSLEPSSKTKSVDPSVIYT